MSLDPLPRSTLEALRAAHVHHLKARLRSEAARAEWRQSLEAGYAALLATRIDALVDPSRMERLVDAAVANGIVDRAVFPLATAWVAPLLREINAEERALGVYVPEAARARIEGLAMRRGALPEHLVRRVVEQEAVEEVMRDVLEGALLTFNERVNPFFADWGLPALLKRIMPLGLGGGMTKGLESLRAEFDKRLEPEVRRFLQSFSRIALAKAADFVVAHQDDAAFQRLRVAVLAWLYEQPVRDLATHDAADAHEGLAAARDIVTHALHDAALRTRARARLAEWLAAEGGKTVGAHLAEAGVAFAPPWDALAEATWPVLDVALASPAVEAWFTGLVTSFYDELAEGAS